MVTASEPSPTRRIGARALAALAVLAAACFPNPPGVRGVATWKTAKPGPDVGVTSAVAPAPAPR